MTIQNSPFGSWNSYRIVERAIQSGQGVIRTLRSTIEEQWEVKIVTHSVWLWIAEQARFLLTRFEVGGDGETRMSDREGKSAKVQRRVVRRRNLVEEETSRRSAWKVDVLAGRWRVFWASKRQP